MSSLTNRRRTLSMIPAGAARGHRGQPDIELASSLHSEIAHNNAFDFGRRGVGTRPITVASDIRASDNPGTDYSQTPDSIRDRTMLLSSLGLLAGRRESAQSTRGDATTVLSTGAGPRSEQDLASDGGNSRISSYDDRSSIDMILAEAGPGGGNLSRLLRERPPSALLPTGDREYMPAMPTEDITGHNTTSFAIDRRQLPPLNPVYVGTERVPKNAKRASGVYGSTDSPMAESDKNSQQVQHQHPNQHQHQPAKNAAHLQAQMHMNHIQQGPDYTDHYDQRRPLLPSPGMSDAHVRVHGTTASSHTLWRRTKTALDLVMWPMQYIPAVVLGLILNLLDGLSYGLIAFPVSQPAYRGLGPVGFSMFMLSTVVSQAVFSAGASAFRGANGSMLIEAIPFLYAMCNTITAAVGADQPDRIVATTMIAYAASTVLTGAVFFALGALHIGALVDFFPRHILVGCIGGVGYFLMQTGLEVTSRVPLHLSWSTMRALLEPGVLALWSSSLAIAVALRVLSARVHHPLVVPLFFMAVPAVFYACVAAFGLQLDELRAHGWVFDKPEAGLPFYHFYTLFDLHNTDWHAVTRTAPTMLGLAFFSILHVPINVPALAVSTAADRVDTNRELVAHGLSNVLSGVLGTFPNYLVYSNSLLFIRSGGGSNLAGMMLGGATLAVFVAGPALIGLIPTMVVGALIFHLGLELLREALIDTVGVVNGVEYATIVAIVVAMAAIGFNEGIFLGVLLACFFFIFLYSRRSSLRKAYTGSAVRSTVRRLYGQRRFLDGVCQQIQVMKLQGFMFFGTINGVEASIRNLLEQRQWQANPIRFLVLDFALVTGLDFSAAEAFIRVRRLLEAREIYMVLSGVRRASSVGRALRSAGVWSACSDSGSNLGNSSNDSDCVQTFATLNAALEWCENVLLQIYYLHHAALGAPPHHAFVAAAPQNYTFATPPPPQPDATADLLGTSPRYAMIERAAQSAIPPSPSQPTLSSTSPALPLLLQAFHDLEQDQSVDKILEFVAPHFTRVRLHAGQQLWRAGQMPVGMYVVESGSLRVYVDSKISFPDTESDPDPDSDAEGRVIESILPGTTMGELPLATGKPYSTTVVADVDTVLWELSQRTFEQLCADEPAQMLAFVRLALAYSAQGMKAITAYAFCAQ
ncbi:hypothetical protein IW150_000536 [Coemansia sp. RSA 2607]|nr:hypothetical protein IW150_000536 [Coemansia sp. RSA 2607]KAJ2398287.1 hypothetical protein GGI05_000181 [Coemansia sp. RSA 2603]